MNDSKRWILYALPVLLLFAAAFWFLREPDPETLSGKSAPIAQAPPARPAPAAQPEGPAAAVPPPSPAVPAPAPPAAPPPPPSEPTAPVPAGAASSVQMFPGAPEPARPWAESGSFDPERSGVEGSTRDPGREERRRRRDEERARLREEMRLRAMERTGPGYGGTPRSGSDAARTPFER